MCQTQSRLPRPARPRQYSLRHPRMSHTVTASHSDRSRPREPYVLSVQTSMDVYPSFPLYNTLLCVVTMSPQQKAERYTPTALLSVFNLAPSSSSPINQVDLRQLLTITRANQLQGKAACFLLSILRASHPMLFRDKHNQSSHSATKLFALRVAYHSYNID